MSEQILYFKCVFNNPTINIIECIRWIIKYLLLLMHGVNMKIHKRYQTCHCFTQLLLLHTLILSYGNYILFSFSVSKSERMRRVMSLQTATVFWLGGGTITLSY